MGTVYDITCRTCLYTDAVYEGAGMEVLIAPAVCPTCREMRSVSRPVDLGDDPSRTREPVGPDICEECSTPLQPWRPQDVLGDPAFGQLDGSEQVPTGPCPKCGGRVEARESGVWD